MDQKGTTFDHDFYVVVGKQYRTEYAYAGHQHQLILYKDIVLVTRIRTFCTTLFTNNK